MAIEYKKNMPGKKVGVVGKMSPGVAAAMAQRKAARSSGGPVKTDQPIASGESGPETWEPEKEFTPPPMVVPPAVAARMEKDGLNMGGVELMGKIPREKRPKKSPNGPGKPVIVSPAAGPAGKKLLSLRLDTDVIEAFKKSGKGWQSKVNAALRQHLKI